MNAPSEIISMVNVKGIDYAYDESDIINFSEGLIGMPDMRRAVLISMDDCKPFYWLVSVDQEKYRFIVVNPKEIFSEYNPAQSKNVGDATKQTLAIVKISSDWQKTTVNLRAPILFDPATKTGEQVILVGSQYQLAEAMPLN